MRLRHRLRKVFAVEETINFPEESGSSYAN